ncbi:diguanylate cyclase (plasmid) [Rhizobium bangladeshense]|nr:diguanylate cyclase [Rhizobium bangladeshense]
MRVLHACSSPALVVEAPGRRVVFANPAANALFGPSEIRQWPLVAELITGWDASKASFPASIRSKAGGWSPCNISLIPLSGEDRDLDVVLISEHSLEHDLEEAKQRLQFVIDMLPQAICLFDHDDRFVLWNKKYGELYTDIAQHLRPGILFEDILRISLASGEMSEIADDEELWLKQRLEKFRQPASQEEQQLRDGRWLRHDDRRTPDGGAIGMRIDITELKQREIWLRELFEANPMPMLLCDGVSLAVLQANNAAVEFYGYSMHELLTKAAADLHVEDEKEHFGAAINGLDDHCNARTVWLQRSSAGTLLHVLIYVRVIYEGAAKRLLLSVADVSDRVNAEREANRLAYHDPLTGLPNRMLFYKCLEEAIETGGNDELVIYCLDLDGFKPVNDTFGHAAGDEVLKEVAKRLQKEAEGRMVARLGGDEFAFVFRAQGGAIGDLANRCIAALNAPIEIKGLPIKIGVSIGIASSSLEKPDGETLIQAADRALYAAKAAGRGTWKLATDVNTDMVGESLIFERLQSTG